MILRRRQIFLNGVNVVLCGNAARFHGATIAWGTKVEKDHALISIPKHADVTACIENTGQFTISVLSVEQEDIARQYGGQRQTKQHAIDQTDLDFDHWQIPVVKNACAQLLCSVKQTILVKEQAVVIAVITDTQVSEKQTPLVYDHSQYFSDT